MVVVKLVMSHKRKGHRYKYSFIYIRMVVWIKSTVTLYIILVAILMHIVIFLHLEQFH